MTEEQKRFKVLKRTSYEEQISQESKDITKTTFFLGLSAAVAIMMFLSATQQDAGVIEKLVENGLGSFETGYSAYLLKNLMQAISKKTMLEGKIDDIDTELEMFENNESRGMKR